MSTGELKHFCTQGKPGRGTVGGAAGRMEDTEVSELSRILDDQTSTSVAGQRGTVGLVGRILGRVEEANAWTDNRTDGWSD